eukprot:TRINITY_DN49045_c0_g1_i1.p1 TRINITY_DN49045_c0_g1~~TRINITY_DN49045_c0_g1_i1.p1  ORF type:complete len:321 (+),score=34.81 TRINITY_DN49045_c0_g1_i1:116-964(+)
MDFSGLPFAEYADDVSAPHVPLATQATPPPSSPTSATPNVTTKPPSRVQLPTPPLAYDSDAYHAGYEAFMWERGSQWAPRGPPCALGSDAYSASAATRFAAARDKHWDFFNTLRGPTMQRAVYAMESADGPFDSPNGLERINMLQRGPWPYQNQAHLSRFQPGQMWPLPSPWHDLVGPFTHFSKKPCGEMETQYPWDMSKRGKYWQATFADLPMVRRDGKMSRARFFGYQKQILREKKRQERIHQRAMYAERRAQDKRMRSRIATREITREFRAGMRASVAK